MKIIYIQIYIILSGHTMNHRSQSIGSDTQIRIDDWLGFHEGFHCHYFESRRGNMSASTQKDPYGCLGIEIVATVKEITRAYRKLALKHHPDRGGNGTSLEGIYRIAIDGIKYNGILYISIATLFQQINQAYELLSDPKRKEGFDKALDAQVQRQKRQQERDSALDAKRRKMKQELMRKEEKHTHEREAQISSQRKQVQLDALKRSGKLRRQDFQPPQAQAQEIVQESSEVGSTRERTVRLKWNRKKHSTSDDLLAQRFRVYGEIERIEMKKGSGAKIVFKDVVSAISAVQKENENDMWKEITLVGQVIPPAPTDAAVSAHPHAAHSSDQLKIERILAPHSVSLEAHVSYEQHVLQLIQDQIRSK